MANDLYIVFWNPVTHKRERVGRISKLGRIAASGDKAALKAACAEIERQHQIHLLIHDRWLQRDALDKGAAKKGNNLEWANVHSPRYYR